MAKKHSEIRRGYGRLLDAWVPPADAGDPIGCIATSFTFEAAFFEEECLGRFLQLESDPAEDGPAYLLEREEKLNQLACAVAVVDASRCAGSRSLRWCLLPARVPRQFLHAKVSLLLWSRRLRLVVASANLTPDGYRRNQEVFGVLDWTPEPASVSGASLREAVAFFRYLASFTRRNPTVTAPAAERLLSFLDRVDAVAADWGIPAEDGRTVDPRVRFVFTGPGRPSLLEQVRGAWPGGGPPEDAEVFSPFFDLGGAPNRPAEALWRILKLRGRAAIRYLVPGEDVPGESAVFLHAPESLRLTVPAGRSDVTAEIHRLHTDQDRPFHAKGIFFQNDGAFAYVVGSSNFTTAGLGLDPRRANIEACLVYHSNRGRGSTGWKAITAAVPPADPVDLNRVRWQPQRGDEAADDPALVALPGGFGDAVFEGASGRRRLLLAIDPPLPEGWTVTSEDSRVLLTDAAWSAPPDGEVTTLEWPALRPPSGLWVSWSGAPARAWWPVQVRAMADLPPPDELRDLPFDVLIQILTASRPLHVVLRDYLRRRAAAGTEDNPPVLFDPLRRVDSSRFLLQRTRRVGLALTALRARLERPVHTEESLAWRLDGPVGVAAVRDSILREARGDGEKAFLLCELALELSRCRPTPAAGALPADRVAEAVQAQIQRILQELEDLADPAIDNLPEYVQAVRQAVRP